MNIVDERTTGKFFKDIAFGDTFESQGHFWLKVKELNIADGHRYNAVDLNEANFDYFNKNETIIPVNTTIVVEN